MNTGAENVVSHPWRRLRGRGKSFFKESVKPRLVSISIPLMLFAVAFGLRVVYLIQAERNDPNVLVLLPAQDMYQYDVTARQYARGNFDFSIRKKLSTSTFYPYLLALVYKVSGGSQRFARVFQVVLSSATVVMLYMIALRFMSKPFAVLCGLILAFYGISIYYSALLLPATSMVFFYVSILWFSVKYEDTHKSRYVLLAALMLGVCVVARPSNIIVFPFFLAWLFVAERTPPKRKAEIALLAILAVMIMPVLWGMKGLILGIERRADFSIGLHMFLVGNTYDSMGIFYHTPRSASEILAVSGGGYIRGIAGLAEGIMDHPVQWFLAEIRKLAAFWIGFEPGNNVDYYLSKDFSSLLRLPLPSFGIVSATGLLGMIACYRQWRRLALLYMISAGAFFSVFAFIILSRYRLIILPTVILFSALAVERIWKHLTTGQYTRAAGLVMAAIILLLLTRSANIRFLYPDSYLRYFDSMARHNLAVIYITSGKPGLGEVQLKRLLESDPYFSQAYATYAVLCESQGREEKALEIVENGLTVMPGDETLLRVQEAMTLHTD